MNRSPVEEVFRAPSDPEAPPIQSRMTEPSTHAEPEAGMKPETAKSAATPQSLVEHSNQPSLADAFLALTGVKGD